MTGNKADELGRRISLHLRKNNFEAARDILNETEADLKRPPEVPVNIAELDMDLRLVNFLEGAGITTLGQLKEVTEEKLLDIPSFGEKGVASVRCALKRAIEESTALCR